MIHNVSFLRCTRHRMLHQRGGSSWQRIFFTLYARYIFQTPHLITLLICSAADTLVLVFRIYGNCTVLLNYSPWMKSSSKQGKLLMWMKRRWLQMPYDIFTEALETFIQYALVFLSAVSAESDLYNVGFWGLLPCTDQTIMSFLLPKLNSWYVLTTIHLCIPGFKLQKALLVWYYIIA